MVRKANIPNKILTSLFQEAKERTAKLNAKKVEIKQIRNQLKRKQIYRRETQTKPS